MTAIERMGWYLSEMNEAEQEVIAYIAQRLHAGRKEYGPLDLASRDWRIEMLQEMADLVNYDAMEKVRTR